jgi:hypothetical protein
MKYPDAASFLYPTHFNRHLFSCFRAVGLQNRFNISIGGDTFHGFVSWPSVLLNNSPYAERLFSFSEDSRTAALTDRGISAVHSVLSGYAFDLRRGRRSLDETRFYYDYVLEDQLSVDAEVFVALSSLPERFFADAYSAATAFRLSAKFKKSYSAHHDDKWTKD